MTTIQNGRTITGRNREVRTTLTDEEALHHCRSGTSNMGRDLARRLTNGIPLTPDQHVWLHIIALEQLERSLRIAGRPQARSGEVQVDLGDIKLDGLKPIVDLMRRAHDRHMERIRSHGDPWLNPVGDDAFANSSPCITISTGRTAGDGRDEIMLRVAEGGQSPGSVVINSPGPRGTNQKFYGRISTEGVFIPGRDATVEVVEFLHRMAADPVKAVSLSGVMTGRCCFCRTRLTDEDRGSVALGYGPVCAANWGLPHGRVGAIHQALGEVGFDLSLTQVRDLETACDFMPRADGKRRKKSVDGEGRRLLDAFVRTPRDHATRLVLADWLEEHGHDELSQTLRGTNRSAKEIS